MGPKKTEPRRAKQTFLYYGFLFGVGYWVLDSILMVFILHQGRLLEQLFSPSADEIWERLFTLAIFVTFGSILGALIEQHQRAEDAARRAEGWSENKYRNLVENSLGLICTHDLDGTLLSVNPAAATALGYEPSEMIGQNLRGFLAASVRPLFDDYLESIRRQPTDSGLLWLMTREGEERVWIYRNVRYEEPGKPRYVLGHAVDVTERQRAEEALRESEARYRAFLEAIPDMIFRISRDGTYLDYKPGKGLHPFVPVSEFLGEKVSEVLPAEVAPALMEKVQQALETGQTQTIEFDLPEKDGPREYEARLVTSGKDEVIAIVDDITERREFEQRLQQAQKMESIGRLAGGVAHDFNNLLGVIVGYSDLVLQGLSPTDALRKKVEEIQKASDRARNLTGQLLAFSRRQILEPQVLYLSALVADMKPMLSRLIGEHIELTLTPAPAKMGRVKADQGQMEQILLNLVVNARDAMPQGGSVRVETNNVEIDEQFARQHPGARPGSYVMLAVSDTGSGMDEETKAHIFEPFYTTKEKGKGTGLGLATVYGIVKQSAGYICVESKPGQGSTFAVYLPQVEEPLPESEPGEPARAHKGGTETILLVEDEALLRTMVSDFLEGSGYQVLEAANGIEAIRIAEEHTNPIHLLLTDVVMPGINGQVLAERLTADRPETKVLFMSGYIDDAVVRHEMLDPDMQFLQKPFTLPVLASRVREMLESEGQKGNPDRGGSSGDV